MKSTKCQYQHQSLNELLSSLYTVWLRLRELVTVNATAPVITCRPCRPVVL
jgi:hypothetical protein